MDHVFREVEPLVSVVGRVLRLLVLAFVLDDPFNVLAAQVLPGYAIQPLPQARHELPGETPVVGGAVGCRCQHLEPQGALQRAHPVRGCRQRPDTRGAGVDQDDQPVQARMLAVLLLDQLDELDAAFGVGRIDPVERQKVKVVNGVGAVPDERQEQRVLLLRRRPERLLDRGLGLGDRRVDQQAPGSRVGAAPHLGVGHHRVQVHRRLGQERQGRQARALRADNQDSPIAGDAHREPLPWLSRSREHIIPLRDRDATGPRPGTARPGEGKRVITGRGKGSSLNSASLTPKPLASSVYVHALEAPSPLKRSISVRSSFPSSFGYVLCCERVAKRFAKHIPGWVEAIRYARMDLSGWPETTSYARPPPPEATVAMLATNAGRRLQLRVTLIADGLLPQVMRTDPRPGCVSTAIVSARRDAEETGPSLTAGHRPRRNRGASGPAKP